MLNARLLTVFQHALGRGGVSQHAPGRGVSAQWGLPGEGEGVCPGGCVYPSMQWGRHPPCGQVDTGENITFAVIREKQDYRIIFRFYQKRCRMETIGGVSMNTYNTWMHRIYISIQQNSHTFYSCPEGGIGTMNFPWKQFRCAISKTENEILPDKSLTNKAGRR